MGSNHRSLVVARAEIAGPARVAIHSDGFPSGLALGDQQARPVDELCALWMQQHARKADDATLLIADLH